jgi:ribA/ribD-fused uncharacterized protein
MYKPDENKVYINNGYISESKIKVVVIHEITHSVTSKIINKILEDPNTPNFDGLNESQKLAYIRLNNTYKNFIEEIFNKGISYNNTTLTKEGLLEYKRKLDKYKAGEKVDFNQEDLNYNPFLNLKEFLAEAFSNKTFQEFLNAQNYKSDKSWLQKLIEDIANFLNRFSIQGVNADSILAQALYDGFVLADVTNVGIDNTLFDPSLLKINIYASTGENAELSNFAVRPFTINNNVFNTVEGYFQARKLDFSSYYWLFAPEESKKLFEKFQNASGAEAKSLGKTIKELNISQWDSESSKIMKEGLLESFKQNPDALQKLLATGNAELTHTQDKSKWGKEFPKLLMEVRQELKSTEPSIPVTEVEEVEEIKETEVNEFTFPDAIDFNDLLPDYSVSLQKDLGMSNLEFIKSLPKEEREAYRELLRNNTFKVKCNG